MKKTIETWTEWWNLGGEHTTLVLIIKKKKGKLTREEVKEACMEHEWAYWLELIDGRGEFDGEEAFDMFSNPKTAGDYAYCMYMDSAQFGLQ